jgi:N-carbamoylputrescine amidase
MRGHAAANLLPVAASNRIGREVQGDREVTFYGSSFLCGPTGDIVARASRDTEEILVATFDLDAAKALRRSWGLFRDRRPDLYRTIAGFDGS